MGFIDRIRKPVYYGRILALELAVDMSITRSLRSSTSAFVALAVLLLTASTVAAQSPSRGDKLDKFLRHRAQQLAGRTRVIVQFEGDADVRVLGKRAAHGRRLGRSGQVAEVDNNELARIASNPRVKRVTLDRPVFATLERTGLTTGATLVRQQMAVTGRGVGIAVIDSGITNWHDDLYRSGSGRVAHFKDFTTDTRVWSNGAYDDYGHGTHVAGIIAGTGYDSNGKHKGIAPSSKLVGLKVMDRLGRGYMSDVIAAIDYAISVKATYNIRVINLSVASGVYESVLARSSDSRGATGGRCRDRGRGVGRQPGSELSGPEADRRHHVSWKRAVGADRWRIERRRHEPSQQ